MRVTLSAQWKLALIAVALAGALAAFLATPNGRSLAGDALSVFRVKRFAAITFDPNQPTRAFPDLSQFGTVTYSSSGRERSVSSAAEATKVASLQVKLPRDPQAAGEPRLAVTEPSTAIFTFDVNSARRHLAERGETSFAVPDRFHGANLTLTIPAMVIAQYEERRSREPAGEAFMANSIVIIQGRAPSARVEGQVTLEELRSLLLSMPGLPTQVAAQLRAIDDWTNTLPVPVPRELGLARDVRINGNPGLAIADNTGAGGIVLWTEGDAVYAVGGGRKAEDLLRIAGSVS